MQNADMLTIDEIAKQLRVNEKTVRSWITSGELIAFPIGKRGYRVSKSDLEAFIDERKKRLQKRMKGDEHENE